MRFAPAAVTWRNVPLPISHLLALVLALVVHWWIPWQIHAAAFIGRAAGIGLVLCGSALVVWALLAAGRTRLDCPDRLIEAGPYGVSRNPMYVAWTIVYVGFALLADTMWAIVLLPVAALWTHRTILREEAALTERFGAAYRAYARRVPRYVGIRWR